MHATLTAHSEYTVPEKSMHPLPMGVIDVLEGTNIFHVNTRSIARFNGLGVGGVKIQRIPWQRGVMDVCLETML